MTDKKHWASDEIRQLIGDDNPPYDTEKVMAWFNRGASALLIELEVLEEHFRLHSPDYPLPEARFTASDFDIYLKLIVQQAVAVGIDRQRIMKLFLHQAFDTLINAPGAASEPAQPIAEIAFREAEALLAHYSNPLYNNIKDRK
mgnify:CR=1 FL=1